jgi:hypothetical protein
MNLAEKVLAKLDDVIAENIGYANDLSINFREEFYCFTLIALRRQVEKHQKVYDSIADSVHDNNPLCDCGSSIYPCTFIKEVAHDLGISE